MISERLSPYLQRALAAAEARALEIHADHVAREHLIERLFADEDSALATAVLDAFADPEGMAVETLALSPGILIVGSGEATPFSTRAVAAMHAARRMAIECGAQQVGSREALGGCLLELPDGRRKALEEAGLQFASSPPNEIDREIGRESRGDSPIREEGHLFHSFSQDARRMLVFAAREASRAAEGSISPARLLLGALQTDRPLAERCGITVHRARLILGGHTIDASAPPERAISHAPEFAHFLEALPESAGSIDVALQVLRDPRDELAQILLRQKVGPDRLQAAREAFSDPI